MKRPRIDEDNLGCNVDVHYKGKLYTTGNRLDCIVELYKNEVFYKTVDTKDITVSCSDIITHLIKDRDRKQVELDSINKLVIKWEKYQETLTTEV